MAMVICVSLILFTVLCVVVAGAAVVSAGIEIAKQERKRRS